MIWKYIAIPIVGAVIGYITNWIAVKMLFFPYYERRFLGYRLPFTPGVIPKGRPRLAKAAGEVIEEQLLNEEVMREILLSEEMEIKIIAAVYEWEEDRKRSDTTCRDTALMVMSPDRLNDIIAQTEEDVTDYIKTKIQSMEPAEIIAQKVVETARSKLADTMVGMFLSGSFMDKLEEQIQEMAQEYLDANLYPLIDREVLEESLKLQQKPVRDIFLSMEGWDFSLPDMVWDLYKRTIENNLGTILANLKISAIVQDKINSMDIEQLEEIVLYIMKKELSAVVNIGALIGFLLGLANLVILFL